ncbi:MULTISPECIES: MMPL family transporter [Dehalobacter]|uniref:efflux RND transporter permease subunit n=1 Tax=Dehalobacter TaxID=56112 RepID=UPI002589681F|nr:MMPL family transporter [Dehalobacter sp.]MDJ0305885.1 MMPL family transporter [Dehalobacter sp.]
MQLFIEKFVKGLIVHKRVVLLIYLAVIITSIALVPRITVNYDLAEYLPEHSMTKQAITLVDQEFGYPGTAQVMVEGISIREALEAKEKIKEVPGVKNVIWLDDVTDITVPEAFISQNVLDSYYKDGAALFQVEFAQGDYSMGTGDALKAIRASLGENVSITGEAEDSSHMREVLGSEMSKIMIIVIPLCVLILMLACYSWIEPLLYLSVIGVSVIINAGTNAFFHNISFITNSIAAVLQFAISMDFSLFLCHRYLEEKDAGAEVLSAIVKAVKNTLSSISASALTIIAGFLALLFMQYGIGKDLGLVLVKGICLSYISVIILLPILIAIFHKTIDKTRHRPLVPPFMKIGRGTIKVRYLLFALVVMIVIPSFLAQKNTDFLYGNTSGSSSEGTIVEERNNIESRFGVYNPVVVLVPNDDIAAEIQLAQELEEQKYIRDVQTLVTLADPAIPRSLLPQSVRDMFLSEHYTRMIVLMNIAGETPETFEAVAELEQSVQKYYPGEWYAAGNATSIADIKNTVEQDTRTVNLFSILSVGLIILLTFRSISVPVLLIAVIESSIWINMGIPYFQGSSLVFIGYLVVSSIQLGATIDYGILMSNRYLEFRKTQKPRDAVLSALNTAGNTVMISALILAVAGFAEGLLSQIKAISDIGILLGRGAALSGLMVLVLLPVLLMTFDKIIMKTTLSAKESGREETIR